MRKLIVGVASSAALFLFASPVLAKVDRVSGPWQLTAPQPIAFSCGGGTYDHTLLDVTDNSDGSFTGNGWYDANNSYTWNIDGNINVNAISFRLVYTGLNSGYTLNVTGTIAPDGSISGTTDGNCQSFTMPAGSAVQFTGNHGQYVKSQEDKQAAAQSDIGMPVQSEDHD